MIVDSNWLQSAEWIGDVREKSGAMNDVEVPVSTCSPCVGFFLVLTSTAAVGILCGDSCPWGFNGTTA